MGSGYPKIIPVPFSEKHCNTSNILDYSTAGAITVVNYSISVARRVELPQIHQPGGILLEPKIIVNNFGALGFGEGTTNFAADAFAGPYIATLRVLTLDATHRQAFTSAIAVTSLSPSLSTYKQSIARRPQHFPSKSAHSSG